MKVFFAGGGTGGHLMPALALADALRAIRPDIEPVMVGARRGIEASILPDREPYYRFHLLDINPLYRKQWWRNASWFLRAPRLALACRKLVAVEKPALAVGTGGYAAGPILYAAHRARVPVVLQEQNAYPGLTTRLMAGRAAEIYCAFEEAIEHLPKKRGRVLTFGNPVAVPTPATDDATVPLIPADKPAILVMGGSQGARAINAAVAGAIDKGLMDDVVLLWSTGQTTFDQFGHYHDPPRRHVRAFWSPITTAYRSVQLVVGRAGAMTIAELRAWGLPSILIPLPSSAEGHQIANARALASLGGAIHLPEDELSPEVLMKNVMSVIGDQNRRSAMAHAAREGATPDAAAEIAARLNAVLKGESLS